MARYNITLHTVFNLIVEAETEDEAREIIRELDAAELEREARETGDWYDVEIDVERCAD